MIVLYIGNSNFGIGDKEKGRPGDKEKL